MNEYTPDSWVILHLPDADVEHYRVLGGWGGGYLDGDSWRLNSGITSVEFDGAVYKFYGHSGSCYECHKDGYGLRMSIAGIYNRLQEKYPSLILMDEDTDWLQVDWKIR